MTLTDSWQAQFAHFFREAVEGYRAGKHSAADLVDADAALFLRTIGHSSQEFFDFAEDHAKGGEPTLETALALAAIRRDYFINEQKGKFSSQQISTQDLPAKDAEIEGIGWLPRIMAKARAKLRGEMPPDLMYDCGGDRKFFRFNGLDPVEFLRETWKAGDDSSRLISWVKERRCRL